MPESRWLAQATEVGMKVGRPVATSDPDGNSPSYASGDDAEKSFDHGASTGQVKTKVVTDAETKSSYTVTISVMDNKNVDGGRLLEIDYSFTVNIAVTTVEISNTARRYNADEDGLISRDEAMEAAWGYFNGAITRLRHHPPYFRVSGDRGLHTVLRR